MPPRRRVRRPLPPTTPKHSLAANNDSSSSSSSPDPLDVISERGSPSPERHTVYIKPGQRERRKRNQSTGSSIRGSEHQDEDIEINNTRNTDNLSEGSQNDNQETVIESKHHQQVEGSAAAEESESEDEWASFRFSNDKEQRNQSLRDNTGFSDLSTSDIFHLEPVPVWDQLSTMSDVGMDEGERGIKVENMAHGEEEEVAQKEGSQETSQVLEPSVSAEEGPSSNDIMEEASLEVSGQQRGAHLEEEGTEDELPEAGPEDGGLGSHTTDLNASLALDTKELGLDDTTRQSLVSTAPEKPDSPVLNDNQPQVETPIATESRIDQVEIKNTLVAEETATNEPVAASVNTENVEQDYEMEMGAADIQAEPLDPAPNTASTDEGGEHEVQLAEPDHDHDMDAVETRPNTLEDQVASTPAPSIPELEEGEDEIDQDTAPTPDAEDADPAIDLDVDVDMDGSSVIADEPKVEVKIRKKPGPKPKPKQPGAGQKVEAAAKKTAKGTKGKPKVDELKISSKSKTARFTPESNYPSSASVASSSSKPAEDTPDPTSDRTYCVCRKRESEDDEDVLMVGCESCDDWFHAACVGLSEDQVQNLDVYICRSCERSTKQKTVYKKACKREGCQKGLGTRESKFCSDLCAYKHFRSFTDSITNKKTLKVLSTSFGSFPKPVPVQIVHHAEIQPTPLDDQTQQLITAVQDQISATSAALEVLRKRQHILQIAIDRAEVLEPIIVQPEEGRSGKGRRKGGNGPTEDKQCGWDPRLIWEDEAVQSWMEGQDEEEICGLAKRRCDKHQGWQKTSAFSLETEERQLSQKHDELEIQKESLVKSVESAAETEKARSDFKARLVAKGRA